MLRWLTLAAVISIAFSEEATEISKGSDVAEIVESAPVAQETAESHYPIYGRRLEGRDRNHGYKHHELYQNLKGIYELQDQHELRHHEPKGHYELHESHEPRQHEPKGHHELHELFKPHELYRPREPHHQEIKGHHELHELFKPHEIHKPREPHHHEIKGHHELHTLVKQHELHKPRQHEPRQHEPRQYEPRQHEQRQYEPLQHEPHEHKLHQQELKGHYELHELRQPHELRKPQEPHYHELEVHQRIHKLQESHKPHEPRHHDEDKGHHKEQTDKQQGGHHDEHEHYGPSVAKSFDPHRVAYHNPHGVGIIKDVLSPDYVQPTWFLDYRYVKTGDRDYAIADGGQVIILPEHVKNHEPKEYDNFAELLEASRLKKLAEKNAHEPHPEKGHGLGYMRSQEDRMEQVRGRMVHEYDRHRDHIKGNYEE